MAVLDPELVRQMADADDEGTIDTVVCLKPKSGAAAPEPQETERLANELVSRAQRSSGRREHGMNVFGHMGSFAVSAPKAFVRTLIDQPEVASATASRQPTSGMIPPVSKRPAKLKEIGRELKARRPHKPAKPRGAPR